MNEIIWQPGIKMDEAKKTIMALALRHFHGNKTKAAESLGIAARTIYNNLGEREDGEDADEVQRGGALKEECLVQAPSGICVEPTTETTAQQSLPVRERDKVQEVSYKQAGGGNSRKGR